MLKKSRVLILAYEGGIFWLGYHSLDLRITFALLLVERDLYGRRIVISLRDRMGVDKESIRNPSQGHCDNLSFRDYGSLISR